MIYENNKQFKIFISNFIDSRGVKQTHVANKLGLTKQAVNAKLSTTNKQQIALSLDDAKDYLNVLGYDLDINIVPMIDNEDNHDDHNKVI